MFLCRYHAASHQHSAFTQLVLLSNRRLHQLSSLTQFIIKYQYCTGTGRYTVFKFIWAPSTSHENIMSCMKGMNSGINLRLTAIIALLEIPIIPFETWCESMNLCKLRGACGRCCLFYNMADEGEKKARTSFRKFTYRSALQRRAWVQ